MAFDFTKLLEESDKARAKVDPTYRVLSKPKPSGERTNLDGSNNSTKSNGSRSTSNQKTENQLKFGEKPRISKEKVEEYLRKKQAEKASSSSKPFSGENVTSKSQSKSVSGKIQHLSQNKSAMSEVERRKLHADKRPMSETNSEHNKDSKRLKLEPKEHDSNNHSKSGKATSSANDHKKSNRGESQGLTSTAKSIGEKSTRNLEQIKKSARPMHKNKPPPPGLDFGRLMMIAAKNHDRSDVEDGPLSDDEIRKDVQRSKDKIEKLASNKMPKPSVSVVSQSRETVPKRPSLAGPSKPAVKPALIDKRSKTSTKPAVPSSASTKPLPSNNRIESKPSSQSRQQATVTSRQPSSNSSATKTVSTTKTTNSVPKPSTQKSERNDTKNSQSAQRHIKKPDTSAKESAQLAPSKTPKAEPKKAPLMKTALATVKAALHKQTTVASDVAQRNRSAMLISAPIFDMDGGNEGSSSLPKQQPKFPTNKNLPTTSSSSSTVPKRATYPSSVGRSTAERPTISQANRPQYPQRSQHMPSSGKSKGGMSQEELFRRKLLLKKEEERLRLMEARRLAARDHQWDVDDDDEDDEEYDSEMDDFIDDAPMDDADAEAYSKHIRDIFGYDKRKYRNIDDDDDPSMEASYRDIEKEESRSAKLGLLEDLEEYKREEEELRRKAMKKIKKK